MGSTGGDTQKNLDYIKDHTALIQFFLTPPSPRIDRFFSPGPGWFPQLVAGRQESLAKSQDLIISPRFPPPPSLKRILAWL